MPCRVRPAGLPQRHLVSPGVARRPMDGTVRVRRRARMGALQQRARTAHAAGEHAADNARRAGGEPRARRRAHPGVRLCAGRAGRRIGTAIRLSPRRRRVFSRAGRSLPAGRRVRVAAAGSARRRCLRGAWWEDGAARRRDRSWRPARRRRPPKPPDPPAPAHAPRRARHVRSRRRPRSARRTGHSARCSTASSSTSRVRASGPSVATPTSDGRGGRRISARSQPARSGCSTKRRAASGRGGLLVYATCSSEPEENEAVR